MLYIADSDGNLNVFNVEHNEDGQWFNSNNGHPDNVWNADNHWVFRLPRNSLHFSPISWESFVFEVVHAIRQASCRFHLYALTVQDIFCYQLIWFPRATSENFKRIDFLYTTTDIR